MAESRTRTPAERNRAKHEPASKKPVTESAAGGAPAVAKSQY